jgi:hypothetical protein
VDATEAIDQAIQFMDNLPSGDGDNAARRTRYLSLLIESVDEIRQETALPSMLAESDEIDVDAADSFAELPDDFGAVSTSGTVILVSTGDEMDWVPEKEIIAARRGRSGATSVPGVYSIFGVDDTSFAQLIQFPPLSTGISVRVLYLTSTPALDDSTNADNLKIAIPSQYHQSVLIPLLRSKVEMGKSDSRASEYYQLYEKAVRRMKRQEFPTGKQSPRGLRSFFGSN